MQKKNLVLLVFLVLTVAMIGCSGGGGSSSGSSTSTTTSTPLTSSQQLVGTWNQDGGGTGIVFKSDGTGNLTDGVHGINSWTLNNTTLVLNLSLNGVAEVFQLAWTNDAHTKMTLHNIGPNSSETTAYTKQ